ncbi:MAG: carboxypeptidase-like regulatory domain-containing protein [Candidatus ainarchaeum sp.]|nr:carboxypeptidase-like regulatory domain-containing protein [Candidatus ainarchaeum sp.]
MFEKIGEIYTKIEDKYFDVLDALEAKGLPVYKYSDFFEDKGIPSLVVTFAIFVLLLSLIIIALTYQPTANTELSLSLKDALGNSLDKVRVKITDSEGNILSNSTVDDGGKISLSGILKGKTINLQFAKDGYKSQEDSFVIGDETTKSFALHFDKDYKGINAKIRLFDNETKTKVKGAKITANYEGSVIEFKEDTNSIYAAVNVPESTSISLTVIAEGYNQAKETIAFTSLNSEKSVYLTPSDQSTNGKSNLLITVKEDENKFIENAKVTIFNKSSEEVLFEDVTTNGKIVANLSTGIALKIVVVKDGYLTYNSQLISSDITLRKAEESIEINLEKGGKKLTVKAVNEMGVAIIGATIKIYSMDNKLIEEKNSEIETLFDGLESKQYIVTASKDSYLSNYEIVDVSQKNQVSIPLTLTNSSNSVRLDVYTLDNLTNSISNVNVKFFLVSDSNLIPYGVDVTTSALGYAEITLPSQTRFYVYAENEIYESKLEFNSSELAESKIMLTMIKKQKVIEMKFIDPLGLDITGNVKILTTATKPLFEGEIINSKIFFNRENYEKVNVKIELTDGNYFSTQVSVKSKDYVEVIVYTDKTAVTPLIEFVGIENENGEEVKGLTPSEFYYATFKLTFPIGANKAGVNLRAGNDAEQNVNESNFAIYDLSIDDAYSDIVYSTSFSPLPLPGNEVVDRENIGSSGEANKWIEGTIDQPTGTYIIKAKIRVNSYTTQKPKLHFRAWSELEEEYYRTPTDDVLGLEAQTDQKNGLYANTLTQELNLFELLPECVNDSKLCATYNYVDAENNYYSQTNFEPIIGKIYALEMEFISTEGEFLQIDLTTDSNVDFIGIESNLFTFPDVSNYQSQKEMSITSSLTENGKQTMRLYFIGNELETATINLSVTGTSSQINKSFSFNVIKEQKLYAELSKQTVGIDEDIKVKVTNESLAPVTNALIKLVDKDGIVIKSITGNNTSKYGKDGSYTIKNNFEVGAYTIEVSLSKYKTEKLPLLISTNAVLKFPAELSIKMPLDAKNYSLNVLLENLSELDVSSITYELSKYDQTKFKVTVNGVTELAALDKTQIEINVEYIGINETDQMNLNLKIIGLVQGSFETNAKSELQIYYNKPLDSTCLKITPTKPKISLVGTKDAVGTTTFLAKNECDQIIDLTATVKNDKKNYLEVTADQISLASGEEKEIMITATNQIERQLYNHDQKTITIEYNSSQLSKTIKLGVELLSARLALSYTPQVVLYLSQATGASETIATQPIFVRNISSFPVKNLQFTVSSENATDAGVTVTVEPTTISALNKGDSLIPTRVIYAKGKSTLTTPLSFKVFINGEMDTSGEELSVNDNYNYYQQYVDGTANISDYVAASNGQYATNQTLGVINVEVNYSGAECLKAYFTEDSTFSLTSDSLPIQKVTIENRCAEPVTVTGIKATNSKDIIASIPTIPLAMGQTVVTSMTIASINPSLNLKSLPVNIIAVTNYSQIPIESKAIYADIISSEEFSKEVSKSRAITILNCGVDGKKEEIQIPKAAVGGDCSNGYCDAEEGAIYLAKKVSELLKQSQAKAYLQSTSAETLGCKSTGVCSIAAMGIENKEFIIYLKNDNIDSELLSQEFDKVFTGLQGYISQDGSDLSGKNFMFERRKVDTQTVYSLASSAYGGRVFIDTDLSGCGYYKVKIDGAFQAIGDNIIVASPTLALRVVKKLKTSECSDVITNSVNFTPFDKGYSLGDNPGTWLTTVNSEDKTLEEFAKEFSKNHFNLERYGTATGNQIVFRSVALSNGMAQVCLDNGVTKTITVNINPNFGTMDKTQKTAFYADLSKTLSSVLNGTYGENCIETNAEQSCILITNSGTTDIGIKLDSDNLNYTSQGGCVDGEVYSITQQKVKFDVSTLMNKESNKEFLGVRKITIDVIDNEKGQINYYSANYDGQNLIEEKNESLFNLEFKKEGTESRYMKKIRVCAYPSSSSNDAEAFISANNSQFSVGIINQNGGSTQNDSTQKIITLQTNRLHPDDLIEIVYNQQEKIKNITYQNPYYFTITWKGNPELLENFEEYVNAVNDREDGPLDKMNLENTTTQSVSLQKSAAYKSAMTKYALTCAATSAVCNLGTGPLNVILGVLADCGTPTVTTYREELMDAFPWAKTAFEFLDNMPVVGSLIDLSGGAALTSDTIYKQRQEASLIGGAAGATSTALVLGTKTLSGISLLNQAQLKSQFSSQLTKEFKTQFTDVLTTQFTGTGVDKKAINTLVESATKEFQTGFETSFDASIKKLSSERGFVKGKSIKNMGYLFKDESELIKYVNSAKSNAITKAGNTIGENQLKAIAGKTGSITADELKSVFKSTFKTTADKANITSIISSKLATVTGGVDAGNAKILYESVSDELIDELLDGKTHGLNLTEIAKLKTDLKTAIKTKVDSYFTAFVSPNPKKPIVPTIDSASLQKIIASELDTKIGLKGDWSKLTVLSKSELDAVGNKIIKLADTELDKVASAADTVGNRKWYNKLSSLFTKRMLFEIGRGFGCGYLSNYVGNKVFGNVYSTAIGEIEDKAQRLGNMTFQKNATYKVTYKSEKSENGKEKITPTYELIDTESERKEMNKELTNKNEDEITGRILSWDKKLNVKAPEQRPLFTSNLDISTSVYRDRLAEFNFSEDNKNSIITFTVNNQDTINKIFQKYKLDKSIVGDSGKELYKPLVTALAVTLREKNPKQNLINELDGKNTYLKDKLIALSKIISPTQSEQESIDVSSDDISKGLNITVEEANTFMKLFQVFK